ncbi:MAG: cytochrome P450 [Mycobacteriaceae bacterium]|nr:cytochrome P450 [Mycobacteriaceae bacterium]
MRHGLNWLAMHGFIRCAASIGVRRGYPQARLIADPVVMANPVSFYEELRARGPLLPGRLSFITTDHGIAQEILRSDDFQVLSLGSAGPIRWLLPRISANWIHPLRAPSLLAVEPPDHTRYRKAVSSVFTTRAVTALRERVEQTASALLDQLADQPDVVDIREQYCFQLPVAIISDILGVPDADRHDVLQLSAKTVSSLDFGLTWRQYRQTQRGIEGFNIWLAEHLKRLRCAPGEDLMSQMIQAAEQGPAETRLSALEIQALAGLVLFAGFETTMNLLGSGIQMLLAAPEQLRLLNERPELWPNAVDEILRLEPPVQLTVRVARKNVELAGSTIKAGKLVAVYLAAANRDPAVFADPHRFDIERSNAGKHLSFSSGRHFCLGASLARTEGAIGLRAFFDRFPDVRAAGPGSRRDSRTLRGWSTIPVELRPARPMITQEV